MGCSDFAGIVLSAGYSSRMGDFKPLLKFGKYTAVEMAVNTFIASGIDDVVVVTGYRGNEVREVLGDFGIRCIENKNYPQGMYSSIVEALRVLDSKVKAFFMLPVDIPLVKVDTVKSLGSKYASCGSGILYPVFRGKKGHPPLIDCKYKSMIENWEKPGGLKNFLNEFNSDSVNVPVCDNGIIMDMDTREDYLGLLKYFNSKAPSKEECYCILADYSVPDNIIKHCEKVSQVCACILKKLNKKGYNFDADVLEAAALLHDISRKSRSHALAGANILRKLGYGHIGDLIGTHMNIEVGENDEISENEILYLADKLVEEDRCVSLRHRFDKALLKYIDNAEVKIKIEKRLRDAEKIMNKVEKVVGEKIELL
ncbi:DVU_1551 family NTP transferase [Clostridium sp. MT-14]|uniref:NTP transferase domain-containing protein n=1 Tax=Clostridium aromativorans TaxID=2836848 RepID=A0ABS8N6Z8_9CLOT|nr:MULTISPECIES: NTP transferase domain-containing protein [Clostridium]KAA8678815.1 NTP transferase domain-containing protein [Clostridium sp. HV4-5-A1G]MCC9295557.1 NTP transferase domain-containing protein [Clostridium aromativorans]CAB1245936.1 Molybdenum cofactor cytidylyltransferase [Clostridiaceae bacterium BL-3]